MKINSHCWLRLALQGLQCIFIILWKYSNKHRTGAAALIRGRRLLTSPLRVRRLIKGGAYSGAALIRVNTVSSLLSVAVGNKKARIPPGGGGVLPYMGYTGTCRWIWYGFWRLCPEQGI